jgi:hypothetical protein
MLVKLARMKARELSILVVWLIISAVLIARSDLFQRPNNGDGWRVLRSAQVVVPVDYHAKTPFSRYYDFKEIETIHAGSLVPTSSTALIVELISFSERAANFAKFDFRLVTLLLYCIYLFGILKFLLTIRIGFAIPTLFILINPYILAYFNSPYEESLPIALCPLLSFLLAREAASNTLAARAIALVCASSKIQFSPAALLGVRNLKWRNNFLYLIISSTLVGAVILKASRYNVPNGYNRYFNGLSYSMAKVSDWPANEFVSRRAIAGDLTANAEIVFPPGSERSRRHWGSSYWPTGDGLDPVESQHIADNAGNWFWQTILSNPKYLFRILTQPILTAIKADYRMDYIFISKIDNKWMDANSICMQHFGAVFSIASAVGLIISIESRNRKHVLLIGSLFCYPLFVVYGDGYYEFEKHLLPALVFGVIFSMYLSFTRLPSKKLQRVSYPDARAPSL